MYNTKNDISAGQVKLDYEALKLSVAVAMEETIEKIRHYLTEISNDSFAGNRISSYSGQMIKSEATLLAKIVETYDTLWAAQNREITIVNKKEDEK